MTRSRKRSSNRRRAPRLLALAVLLIAVWLLLPVAAGGHSDYVITHGTSMEPGFHTGDLAVVRAAGSYRVGDVVAYRSQSLHTTVMHRIVAIQGGRYLFKGDNNSFIDPEHPGGEQLIGTLALRIPQGGTWLHRITGPGGLALATLFLLTAGTRATRPRDRRRRRNTTMSNPRPVRSPALAAAMSTPAGRAGLTATATLAIVGMLLAFMAWKAPRDLAAHEAGSEVSTSFAYHATVGRTPAYDSDTVTSPDPVFRRLAHHVDLDVRYAGPPGTMTLTLEVAASNGWHTTLPLQPATAFDTSSHHTTVPLDLNPVEQRAKAAAQVIGTPYDILTLAVHAHVRTADGQQLTPTLNLLLTPSQLKLAGGPNTLTVATETQPPSGQAGAPPVVHILGHTLDATDAAVAAGALLAAALLLALGTVVLSGRRPRDETRAIHARYRDLLLPVHPPASSHLGETVDVQDFTALARTAQRYGLVIMTWLTRDGHVFVVQDQTVRYRYSTPGPGRQTRSQRRNGDPNIVMDPNPSTPHSTPSQRLGRSSR
ncbi:hypothetical protein GCM10028802_41520 [Terrabacter terrigena]|uniref:Signal peptidase I n=1 Tax=Terrabacter terrigena TaxID=574718 RepID=A0ABW3N2R3_9MICO